MSSAFSSLRADNINTNVECLLDVFRVADHVHNGDASFVKLLNDLLCRNTDGANEKCSLLLDDDVNKFRKLSFCVVELGVAKVNMIRCNVIDLTFVFLAFPPTWGSRRSTPKGAFLSLRSAFTAWI